MSLNLKNISLLLLGILVISSLFGVYSSINVQNDVTSVTEKWHEMRSVSSKRAVYLSSLRAELGYGGMIHQFKNYLLRQDSDRAKIVEQKIGGINTIIKQYRYL